MTHNVCELPELELKPLPFRSCNEIIDELKWELSQSDLKSGIELVRLLYNPDMDWGSDAHKVTVAEALATSRYSDAYKRYFAAVHLSEELLFSVAKDQFLSEELIFSHLQKGAGPYRIRMNYFKAMMGSSHLSERIMEAAFEKNVDGRVEFLTLSPDLMVTPRVIRSWLSSIDGRYEEVTAGPRIAAQRIREAHPEYEGFPDEWVIKVFCGE